MRTILKPVGRLANAFLELLDARLIAGNVARPWHHPNSPEILHRKMVPGATYSPWLNDAEFLGCYEAIRHNTLVDVYRCYELWQLGKQLASTEGDYLEVGVWRGGTGCLLAKSAERSGKTVYLADTFSGVVKAGAKDTGYTGGEHKDTSEEIVKQLARRLGLGNIRILKGIFPDETASQAPQRIALLHCDVDVYESARDIVAWAMPRLSPGGIVVFDDYGFRYCGGITRFVNELRYDPRFLIIHNLNGHAILIRK